MGKFSALEGSEKIKTIPELFFCRTAQSGDETAVLFKQDGQWHPQTWRQLEEQVREAARGLAPWVTRGDTVGLLSENRPEWWIADMAVLSLGAASAPIYATNPPKDIAYILNDCRARLLFVSSAEQLAKILALRSAGELKHLERVIVFDELPSPQAGVLSFAELRERGRELADSIPARLAHLGAEDLATLIYTSGTTGEPKGVMLTHRNLVSNALGAREILERMSKNVSELLMLSFLPLSHCLERTAGYYAAIAYNMSVAFAESVQKLVDNMSEVKPTLLVSVPRIYEKLYARVLQSASSGLKRKVLVWSLRVGREYAGYRMAGRPIPKGLALQHAIAHKLVFGKLQQKLGGRLTYAISGGAALAKEIAEFLAAIGLSIYEGYGLSEASPIVACNLPGEAKLGSVGQRWPGVEMRVEPDPERDGADGEILIRGPNVMKGYYNKPAETAEAFSADGWLRTGDVGYLDKEGFLFITDRRKELIKTAGGKYVAPQPIESRLKLHPLIEQAVVVGDRRKYCVALLVPAFEALQAMGDGVQDTAQLRGVFQAAIDEVNRELGSWEQIKRFELLPAEMTQESGELTPSLKVKRRVIDARYKEIIDAMYLPE